MSNAISRRQALLGLCGVAGSGLLGCSRFTSASAPSGARQALSGDPRFLIVIGATGGASIIDSFLAIRESECATPSSINVFPDAQVVSTSGSAIRAVDLSSSGLNLLGTPIKTNQAPFVQAHRDDIMIATRQGTSVNHTLGQKRSLTGNGAFKGRTLQEAVAAQYGGGRPMPNANMGAFGFLEAGTDDSLPSSAGPEPIASPLFYSLGMDGRRGIKGAPSADVMALMRKTRDEQLDPESVFSRTFHKSAAIQRWLAQRGAAKSQIETLDLVTKLCMLPNLPGVVPLDDYGLATSPDGAQLMSVFPNLLTDPLEAQAALAFLLIKYGVSVSVTLSPTFAPVIEPGGPGGAFTVLTPPLAFDNSHQKHRQTQALMWDRTLSVITRLIGLLGAAEYDGTGTSYWSRTLIYVATDFGRSKGRDSATDFGSGHDLNNGVLVVSPLANGNRVLGGVDPNTGLTYGFDLQTGTADPSRTTSEAEIYAGIAQALGVDVSGSGLPDVPAMRRS